jgi:uncharacterized protein YhfF
MDISKESMDYWDRYQKETGITKSFVSAWSFGDNPELADELLKLVLTGKKTGKAMLVIELEREGEKIPEVGDYNIVLDGNGKPTAIIRTISVEIKPFNEVEEAFAYSEGENDRTLESWRREHWKYWTRVGQRLGFAMKEDLLVVCENFKLVYPR